MIEPRAFLRRFVLPLCAGGELHVGRPLGAAELATLLKETELELHEENRLLAEARARVLSSVWLYPLEVGWDTPSARLAAAIHNLLALSHPDLGGRRARERIERFTAGLLALPPPAEVEELLRRHSLCAGVLELTRTDVDLDTWAAVYSFRGQEPPRRLLRWKGLRRVREARRTLRWLEEEAMDEAQVGLLGALFAASPLTALLSPTRARPPLELGGLARYLRTAAVARLCVHAYLELGLRAVGPSLARAFWQLSNGEARRRDGALETICGLVGYLFAARALARPAEPLEGPEELEADLPAVLLALSGCGQLPSAEALGDAEVARQLARQNELTRRRLGAEAERALTLRLQRSLAA